jgi:hypothetical protein
MPEGCHGWSLRDLEAEELSVLSSKLRPVRLDQGSTSSQISHFTTSYRFFIVPSHSPLVLLPSGPLLRILVPIRVDSKLAPSPSALPAASFPCVCYVSCQSEGQG